MDENKKPGSNIKVPEYAIERFARCVFGDIRVDFAKEDMQAEFKLWMAEREKDKAR